MAIADMNEFTLLTFEAYKNDLLKELQKFGGVQLAPMTEPDLADIENMDGLRRSADSEGIAACEEEIRKVEAALDVLRTYYSAPKGLKAMTIPPPSLRYEEFDAYLDQYEYQLSCESIRAQADELSALSAERNRLTSERTVLLHWSKLDISTPALDSLTTVNWIMGTIAKESEGRFLDGLARRFPASWAECEGYTQDEACILCLIHKDDWEQADVFMKDVGFSRVSLLFPDTVARLLEINRQALDQADEREAVVRKGFEVYVDHYEKLSIALDCLRSDLARRQAAELFLEMTHVVLIHGWAPADSMEMLRQYIIHACGDDYYLEDKPAERDSAEVPVKLKNNRLVAAFEGVTSMYSLPRYNELDPTPLLTPFYLLFFGIMVGDAGYGLLLFFGTLFALHKLYLKPGTRQFMQFLFYLSLSIMAMGLLFGSAFGVTIFAPLRAPDGSPKAIIDASYDMILMIILSVAIGVVHVLFGVAVKGYTLLRERKVADAVFDSLFWILAVASGILSIVSVAGIVPPVVGSIALWVFIGSLIGLTATQGRDSPSLGGKIAGGLFGTYGLTGYVGDLVSYTRLVALSLSGAYIAFSFNLMAGLIPNTVLKYVLGGLIVVAGQTMNLGLSVLGGYVHSCRLQYVEFFGKFYEGGGRAFQPLTLSNEHVEILKS